MPRCPVSLAALQGPDDASSRPFNSSTFTGRSARYTEASKARLTGTAQSPASSPFGALIHQRQAASASLVAAQRPGSASSNLVLREGRSGAAVSPSERHYSKIEGGKAAERLRSGHHLFKSSAGSTVGPTGARDT